MPTLVSKLVTYAYRPSLLGSGWEFKLGPHGIDWTLGVKSGHAAYRSIRRIRMSFRPMSMQTHRFVTDIVADGAPLLKLASTSWKSLVEQERLDQPYSDFVIELHRRAAAENEHLVCERGRSPLLYWPGLIVVVLMAIALAFLIVRALQAHAPLAAVLIGVFLTLFVWQAVTFFGRNRPGAYRPDAVPPELLPI